MTGAVMSGQRPPACSIHGTQDALGTAEALSSSGALVALVSWAEPELAPPPNKMTINKMSPSGPATATSTTVLLGVTGGSLPGPGPAGPVALLATALGVGPLLARHRARASLGGRRLAYGATGP